jgi:hypothetical protein
MSEFSADWLALREPYDHRARNEAVLEAVAAHFAKHDAVSAVDLATGTGSTLRAVSSRLPKNQNWRLVDNNLSLLARAESSLGPKRNVRAMPLDLARDLEAALDGPLDLITTSALLDLVSPDWMERLVVEVAARNLPLYAALSYDGRIEFDSADPLDRDIIAAVNAHQRTDKGFGPALGPDAAATAIARFTALGWSVTQGVSDWVFEPSDDRVQLETLAAWALAAEDSGTISSDATADWLSRRGARVAARKSTIRVGHVDFFACPTGRR